MTAIVGKDSIALTSSEPVTKRREKHFYRAEETYEEDITANRYKQLYENKISAISGSGGENLSFLKTPDPFYTGGEPKKENSGMYILESGGSIVADLKNSLEKGVVRVSMPETEKTPFMCQIEGKSGDGDWFVIGTSGSVNQTYLPFNQKLDQIRISGVSGASIQLNGIHVSKKEWVR